MIHDKSSLKEGGLRPKLLLKERGQLTLGAALITKFKLSCVGSLLNVYTLYHVNTLKQLLN